MVCAMMRSSECGCSPTGSHQMYFRLNFAIVSCAVSCVTMGHDTSFGFGLPSRRHNVVRIPAVLAKQVGDQLAMTPLASCFVMISGCSGGGKSTLIAEFAR